MGNFTIHGPYSIPRDGKLITRNSKRKREFWREVDEEEEGLSRSCGCYVLVIRNVARYIGKTEKQGFNPECFSAHKIAAYDYALAKAHGEPSLFLIVKRTPGRRKVRWSPRGHGDIGLLETLLIGRALIRNPELGNIRGTRVLAEMIVPGLLNSPRGEARASAARALKRAIEGSAGHQPKRQVPRLRQAGLANSFSKGPVATEEKAQ